MSEKDKVKKIKKMKNIGMRTSEIAKLFGITESKVMNIIKSGKIK